MIKAKSVLSAENILQPVQWSTLLHLYLECSNRKSLISYVLFLLFSLPIMQTGPSSRCPWKCDIHTYFELKYEYHTFEPTLERFYAPDSNRYNFAVFMNFDQLCLQYLHLAPHGFISSTTIWRLLQKYIGVFVLEYGISNWSVYYLNLSISCV